MKSTPGDHALAIVKTALNAVPGVGGPLASLIGDYVPTSRQRAIEKAAELLTEKIANIEGRIDTKAIDLEGFADRGIGGVGRERNFGSAICGTDGRAHAGASAASCTRAFVDWHRKGSALPEPAAIVSRPLLSYVEGRCLTSAGTALPHCAST